MDNIMKTKNASAVSDLPDSGEMELISKYSRKKLTAGEIYTFTVVLCDNDIDRDCERFSIESLNTLKDMFTGVTGISDHSMKSSDQTARIYKTEVITDNSKITLAGEAYTYLKGWCYMLRTPKNKDLIDEIEGGIKKEVSVSCAVSSSVCSVCGRDMRDPECTHTPGSTVDGKLCHAILSQPTDAYEWSFVAVPAQRNAGVSKSFSGKSVSRDKIGYTSFSCPEEMIKAFENRDSGIALTKSQSAVLFEYISRMRSAAQKGRESRKQSEKNIMALSAFTLPGADGTLMKSILGKLSDDEVSMLEKSFEERGERMSVDSLRLLREGKKQDWDNSQFRI